jgi:cytosine deaminase
MESIDPVTAHAWLATAVAEARAGLAEGGIPIGAALYGADGTLLGRGRNRRVQDGDPSRPPPSARRDGSGRTAARRW